jgi:hypothetical protein
MYINLCNDMCVPLVQQAWGVTPFPQNNELSNFETIFQPNPHSPCSLFTDTLEMCAANHLGTGAPSNTGRMNSFGQPCTIETCSAISLHPLYRTHNNSHFSEE